MQVLSQLRRGGHACRRQAGRRDVGQSLLGEFQPRQRRGSSSAEHLSAGIQLRRTERRKAQSRRLLVFRMGIAGLLHPSCGADTLPGVEGRISSARQKRGQRRARRGDRLCGDRSALRHHSHSDNRRGRLVGVGCGARIGSRIAPGPTAKDEKEHRFRGVLFLLMRAFQCREMAFATLASACTVSSSALFTVSSKNLFSADISASNASVPSG